MPRSADDLLMRGVVRLQPGETTLGLDDLTEALRVNPNLGGACIGFGLVKARLGLMAEAEAHFADAIRLDPALAPEYLYRGVALVKRGLLEQALADFKTGIELQPMNGDFHCHCADVCVRMTNYDLALNSYAVGLSLAPDLIWARNERGKLLSARGKPDLALADFDEVIRLDPGSDYGFVGRAAAKLQLSDMVGAQKDATEAIRVEPGSASAHGMRAAVLGAAGKTIEALLDLNTAISSDPNSTTWFMMRATPLRVMIPSWKRVRPPGNHGIERHALTHVTATDAKQWQTRGESWSRLLARGRQTN